MRDFAKKRYLVGLPRESSTRDPRGEQPKLDEALFTVGFVAVGLPQGIRQRFDEFQAASDLG